MDEKCPHAWTATDTGYACTECEATCPSCNVCDGPTGTALLVCDRCLTECARVLDGITSALEHYDPPQHSVVPAIRYDQDRRGGSADHVPLRMADDPAEIEAVLLSWVAMWTDLSGDAQNLAPVDYLRGHHLWAAHHAEVSAWDDYRREMRALRHRARRMAGLLPQRQAGTCIYCAGDIVRDWADEKWEPREDGLSDELRCTSCRTQWANPDAWRFANRHTILALPYTHPDTLVTRTQARAIFPAVPAVTWRQWIHLDAKRAEALRSWQALLGQGEEWSGYVGPDPEPERMPVRAWDVRGEAVYLLADLTAHVRRWEADTRVRQRKAG